MARDIAFVGLLVTNKVSGPGTFRATLRIPANVWHMLGLFSMIIKIVLLWKSFSASGTAVLVRTVS
jgi:hypothetical protein